MDMPIFVADPPTAHELETLPHIIMTADVDWNPSIFDNEFNNVETFFGVTDNIVHDGISILHSCQPIRTSFVCGKYGMNMVSITKSVKQTSICYLISLVESPV
jgi:hypothetical protein